jgi:hypothetical protein
MYQGVIDFFPEFSKKLEGCVYHMYLDCIGKVTTGIGCLIDPVELARPVPWVLKGTTTRATPQQIHAEWALIKSRQDLAKYHYSYAGKLCNLRLTEEGVDQLLAARMKLFETDLKKEFPEWDIWPADAQLGVMSMAWAMGSGFTHTFKNFTNACKQHQWLLASDFCHINEKNNVGIIPRNKLNKMLFKCASWWYGPTNFNYKPYEVSVDIIKTQWSNMGI